MVWLSFVLILLLYIFSAVKQWEWSQWITVNIKLCDFHNFRKSTVILKIFLPYFLQPYPWVICWFLHDD